MLGSFSRSPLQAHTGDPNDHILVSLARGTTPYTHITLFTYACKHTHVFTHLCDLNMYTIHNLSPTVYSLQKSNINNFTVDMWTEQI